MSHPGLLLDDDTGTTPLADHAALTAAETAGLIAALAATIADLHDMGVQLGGFSADDVVLDAGGRPLLRAVQLAHDDEAGARVADVRSLGTLLSALLPDDNGEHSPTPRPVWAWLRPQPPGDRVVLVLTSTARRAMAATPAGPRARQVADAIASQVADARLPHGADERDAEAAPARSAPGRKSGRLRLPAQWIGAAVVVIVLGAVVATSSHRPSHRAAARPATPVATASTTTQASSSDDCPVVTAPLRADIDEDGCDDALDYSGGVLSSPVGRFRVGEAGDHAATGHWSCGQVATLALLRPDGSVYVADDWASPGDDVVLRPVATVAGAVDIGSAAGEGGCDQLVVHKGDGTTTTVQPERHQ